MKKNFFSLFYYSAINSTSNEIKNEPNDEYCIYLDRPNIEE